MTEIEKRKAELNASINMAKTDEELNNIALELRKLEMLAPKEERSYDGEEIALANGVQYRGTIADNMVRSNNSVMKAGNSENDMEYRNAFKNFITKGTPIPKELRANTLTTDVATAIPHPVLDRIISQLQTTGQIFNLVTKTALPSGFSVPVATIKPKATWVNEGEGSDFQKVGTTEIVFANYKLRCAISMSMEVSVMSISSFETFFVNAVSEAMMVAIEQAIISGAGASSKSAKGILTETPPAGQLIDFTKFDYATLMSIEAAIPDSAENTAVYCMSKKTFFEIQAMVDAQGQPIAKTNYGIAGKPERELNGRPVILAGAYLDATPEVKLFAFTFKDYILNTIYNIRIGQREVFENENMETKAVMGVDGKVADVSSLVIVKAKGKAAPAGKTPPLDNMLG